MSLKQLYYKPILVLIKTATVPIAKQYHAYWQWVEERNEARYQQNIEHGRSYDSKNMMHTFRLLYIALGIAIEKSQSLV